MKINGFMVLFFSFILLILLFPILFGITIIIKCKLGSPIFFKQKRPGLYGKPFLVYKFRTMKLLYDNNGSLLPDQKRLTSLGRILRKYSLDELPQLVNVLKGDMSLVGPRPLLLEYMSLYTDEQNLRHHVKPGITGWAQINGRNEISWEEKLKLDLWYIKNQNMKLDLKIFFKTIVKVLRTDGVKQKEHATMEKLTRSDEVI